MRSKQSGDHGHKPRTSMRAINPLSSGRLLSGSPETETSQRSFGVAVSVSNTKDP